MAATSRRSHKKSKNGCVECKQRHMKCDENHPTCGNCKISLRGCLYKDSPTPRSQNTMYLSRRSKRSASTEVEDLSSLSSSSSFSAGEDAEPKEVNMLHLELFRHFIDEHSTLFGYDKSIIGTLSPEVTDMLFVAPYLMSQGLAFAALHLSATVPARQQNLRKHATRLQGHALATFNCMNLKLDVGNCVPIFLFKSIHAFHILSEKLSDRSKSFDGFLDDITDVMRVHQDVRAITRKSWDKLLQSALSPLLERESNALSKGLPGTECDELSALVHAAPIDLSFREIYLEVIHCLQKSFNGSRKCDLESPTIGPTISWLVTVPPSFIDLVAERQPEALVILSYFGALLHMNREVWAFGSSGMYIIDSIASYLDDSWGDWLHWPNTFC